MDPNLARLVKHFQTRTHGPPGANKVDKKNIRIGLVLDMRTLKALEKIVKVHENNRCAAIRAAIRKYAGEKP